MLKLMGELLKRNVAVESVEVLRKKIKSIKNVYRQELTGWTCEDFGFGKKRIFLSDVSWGIWGGVIRYINKLYVVIHT